ncbi:hypothetical protein [Yersinia enterocolitica]|uniref:hypothetical protein n=1 Tax=Yersinia enterocolitica TaxID=630 RepID=UPI001C608883|nr:hypothetical protein [Yersinia enterocolitica]MBW5877479.1 hypothetical protein [Yersinia enterocolitica]
MMDITKSREEFEKVILAMGMLIVRSRGGAYDVEEVELSWIIWQSARESIEVELPEPGYYDRTSQFAVDVYEALRTAGIRIKGESE